MTLADIIGGGVQVEWHEAVAVVRDVIERSDVAESHAVPEFDEIALLPFGGVEIRGATVSEEPAQRLVEILRTLTSPDKPPPHFDEVLGRGDGSVESLSDALGYFERPDRVGILRELYSRASGSEPLPEADELIASLRTSPPSTPAPEVQADTPEVSRHKLWYVVGALVILGTSLVGYALIRTEGVASRVTDSVTSAADAVGGAIMSIGERAGLGTAPSPAPAPALEQPDVDRSASGLTRRSRAANGAKTPPLFPALRPATPEFSMWSPDDLTKGISMGPRETHVITASDPVEDIVYSATALDVIPPVGLRPHLPKIPASRMNSPDIRNIELVIRSDGTVASVKLVGSPRNIHDSMLLSAAKTWRFQPATKAGVPVPYRTTIAVAR